MIDLYTAPTPNGVKVSIMLEEVGLEYEAHFIDLEKKIQKEEWYLDINPNGRIPAIIDRDASNFKVFESGAILIYLAEKTGKLLPTDPLERSKVFQWLILQVSGIGPMQGQAHFFQYAIEEKIEIAIQRYVEETKRLFQVLEIQLTHNPFVAGAQYTIADIACWPWVRLHLKAGVSLKELPNLNRWLKNVSERPAVQRGIDVPIPREWPPFEY